MSFYPDLPNISPHELGSSKEKGRYLTHAKCDGVICLPHSGRNKRAYPAFCGDCNRRVSKFIQRFLELSWRSEDGIEDLSRLLPSLSERIRLGTARLGAYSLWTGAPQELSNHLGIKGRLGLLAFNIEGMARPTLKLRANPLGEPAVEPPEELEGDIFHIPVRHLRDVMGSSVVLTFTLPNNSEIAVPMSVLRPMLQDRLGAKVIEGLLIKMYYVP